MRRANSGACGGNPAWCERDAFVHLHDPLIIPGGEYRVEVIDESCDPTLAGDFSAPLLLESGRFGDVAGATGCDTPTQNHWCAPQGLTNIQDVLADLDAFLGKPTAPIKPRAEMVGFDEPSHQVDGAIRIGDVLVIVDAMLGKPLRNTPHGPAERTAVSVGLRQSGV